MLVKKFSGNIVMTAPSGSFDSSSLPALRIAPKSLRTTVLDSVLFPEDCFLQPFQSCSPTFNWGINRDSGCALAPVLAGAKVKVVLHTKTGTNGLYLSGNSEPGGGLAAGTIT
jgi:hypothetical protein